MRWSESEYGVSSVCKVASMLWKMKQKNNIQINEISLSLYSNF